jgi:hypothetical protein
MAGRGLGLNSEWSKEKGGGEGILNSGDFDPPLDTEEGGFFGFSGVRGLPFLIGVFGFDLAILVFKNNIMLFIDVNHHTYKTK